MMMLVAHHYPLIMRWTVLKPILVPSAISLVVLVTWWQYYKIEHLYRCRPQEGENKPKESKVSNCKLDTGCSHILDYRRASFCRDDCYLLYGVWLVTVMKSKEQLGKWTAGVNHWLPPEKNGWGNWKENTHHLATRCPVTSLWRLSDWQQETLVPVVVVGSFL